MASFADINVSQGSVATYARCSGIFANLPGNLPVKKILKRSRIDRIMVTSLWPHLLAYPVYHKSSSPQHNSVTVHSCVVISVTIWQHEYQLLHAQTHPHTHPFSSPLSGTTQVSRYQKGKTNVDFTEARDSEWQWHQLGHVQVCTSLQTDNHAGTPPLRFLQAGRLSCHPNNSVKALKEKSIHISNKLESTNINQSRRRVSCTHCHCTTAVEKLPHSQSYMIWYQHRTAETGNSQTKIVRHLPNFPALDLKSWPSQNPIPNLKRSPNHKYLYIQIPVKPCFK